MTRAAAPDIHGLEHALAGHGLIVLGIFEPVPGDGLDAARAVLVGNAGPAMWRAFAASTEAADGAPHPMDRWTRRILKGVGGNFGCGTKFPFDGPPYLPVLRWLERCAPAGASPLGPYVHRDYGPWFALRGVLLSAGAGLPVTAAGGGPCPTCTDKPCLDACPAGAITRDAPYEPQRCRQWLHAHPAGDCTGGGCLVRHACPYGRGFAPEPAQAAFHMRAFAR
ncbi:MAG: hypothetical protein AB7L41_00645 [Flavobacteriaceae bacterium]